MNELNPAFDQSKLQDQTNRISIKHVLDKEPLKNIKVYIPAEGYDSKLSFEQNLAENKLKLFSELSASDFNSLSDPVQQCMTSAKMHKDLIEFTSNNHSDSRSVPDFDEIAFSSRDSDPNLKINEASISKTPNSFQHRGDSLNANNHSCDVCNKHFNLRRDLALHYLTHSERDKKGSAKGLKRRLPPEKERCEECKCLIKRCKCKKKIKESPFEVTVDFLSIPTPEKTNNVFVKIETVSGKNNVFKREYFHCPECDQVFGLDMQLKQHMLTHKRKRASKINEQSTFSCVRCYQIFDNKEESDLHTSTVHNLPLKRMSRHRKEGSAGSV